MVSAQASEILSIIVAGHQLGTWQWTLGILKRIQIGGGTGLSQATSGGRCGIPCGEAWSSRQEAWQW